MNEQDRLFEMLRAALSCGQEDFLCAYLHDRLMAETGDAEAFKSGLLRCAASAFGADFDPESGVAYLEGRRLPAFKAAANAAKILRVEPARPKPAREPKPPKPKADPNAFDPARCPDPQKAFKKALAAGHFKLASAIVPHLPERALGAPAGGPATALAKACPRVRDKSGLAEVGAVMDAFLARGWLLEEIEDGHRFPSEYLWLFG